MTTSYCKVLTTGTVNTMIQVEKSVNLKHFELNGVPELGNNFRDTRVEFDANVLKVIMQQLGIKLKKNKITSVQRLRRSCTAIDERGKRRPLFIPTNSSHFMDRCYTRGNGLKDLRFPVYI